MIKKRVLLIDDEQVTDYFNSVRRRLAADPNYGFDIEDVYYNPVDRSFADENQDIDDAKARQYLVENILSEKIDVVGCDFNLHESNKALTFEIIKTIREYNKNCSLFVYSGAINKELLRIFESAGTKPGEKLLQIALSSNIMHFENNRSNVPERILEFLTRPCIQLQIENFLIEHGKLKITHSYNSFKDKQLFEIVKDIRVQSSDGQKYCEEILNAGLVQMINLHDYGS